MNYDTDPGAQGICPEGWHIPTIAEWTEFLDSVEYVGSKLKRTGEYLWVCANEDATNETGFSALAGGMWHDYNGSFYSLGYEGDYWSSDMFYTNANCRGVLCPGPTMVLGSYDQLYGISVRCIKND